MAKLVWPHGSGSSAKLLMSGFGIEPGIKGDWLTNDSWTSPVGRVNGGETRSDSSDRLTAETGKGSHAHGLDLAATKLDSLISGHGIALDQATGGEPKLIGLAEARLGIHLDSTFLDALTAKVSAMWNHAAVDHAGSGVTLTAATPDAVAETGTTSTGASVTTFSLLAASLSAVDPIFETRVATAGDDVEE
ncbi:MAG: hypothetical protein ABIQ51_18845, partial [Mesorhizobium sp.]